MKKVLLFIVSIALSNSVLSQINCPPNLPLTLNGNTEYCVGTNGVELSVAENYDQYEWLPTLESSQSVLLTAGNYDLVVTHYTGCTDTLSFEVEQVSNPPQPTITTSGPSEFCEGESVTLSGPSGYAYYEWSSGSVGQNITVYESGLFVLSIEDLLGCVSSSNSLQVTMNPNPTAAFSPSLDMFEVSFNNLSLDATSYQWNFGDGSTSTDFEPSYTYSIDGNLDMYLVAENDCGTDTAFLNLMSVGIDESEEIIDFKLFPNPSSGVFSIQFSSTTTSVGEIEMYDLSGKLILARTVAATVGLNEIDLTLERPTPGVYSFTIQLGGQSITKRLIIVDD